ncbi:MAG TPA: gamma-glutamyl-gamma-aminobutyrate hydrolase family protein [Acidimicrobiia bacterium]|nr:gamma-glutamyl-gamma-aminobutyrate hydrolase family protein [Acidimicrobiia bacterium]
MKPVVGITSWRRTLDTFYGPDRLQPLSTYYTDSVVAAGMTPLLIPAGLDPSEAPALIGLVDGLLLSGGDDVDPGGYGAENTASVKTDPDVDQFEIALVEAAREAGKPVLAICRGLQLLNVAFGGSLHQEVTSEGGTHDVITGDHEEMNARRHVVTFEPGSLLASLYGASETKVNTLHHQGIERLAEGLVVEGKTDDGLVEAARLDGDWWVLGVQWHPERLDGDHQRIFEAFREAISG